MGTVIAFVVTYIFTTTFLVARYFQSARVDKRFDLDLGEFRFYSLLPVGQACGSDVVD